MDRDISGDIKLEDERGEIIEALKIHIGEVFRLIDKNMSEEELSKTFCLQFIDPWGDTIFNRVQIGILIKEFENLFDKCQTKEEREKTRSIITFISKAEELHTFVRFYGD
jgi:hypothetical protein